MEPLNITHNADGTWTLVDMPADPVSISHQLWAELELSEHVVIDRHDVDNPDEFTTIDVQITATNYWLSYSVIRETADGYQLQLRAYSEL
ncbi:MAG TPA: hypothetical protein VIQ30_09185 [Pseudonocardia sp.]